MSLETSLGIVEDGKAVHERGGQMRGVAWPSGDSPFLHRTGERCPADRRIEAFLNEYFDDLNLESPLHLPSESLILPRHGIARDLSIPEGTDSYSNLYLASFRVRNGVLHNPRSDRRTTQGTFHIAEGGLPIPGDKKAVPRPVFIASFRHAVTPPAELLVVPYTANRPRPLRTFVSLLLRPIVCPEVPGICPRKPWRFTSSHPGGLVSNLDFVESIFGNAGDPYLPENDAGLDVEHWTGHTGCVILAPHLTQLTKREARPAGLGRCHRRQRKTACAGKNRMSRTMTVARSSSPAARPPG